MTQKPANFLFLFPDQWRYDCLSAFKHPNVHTPFIDDIVANGVTFDSAYSACPSCIATRASLLTGLSPNSCGRVGYGDYIPWTYDSLITNLRDGGYQTMCVGKTHFYPERAHLGFEQLELYSNQNLDGDFPSDYHRWLEEKGGGLVHDTALAISSTSWPAKPWMAAEELHPTAWNTNRTIDLLRKRDPLRPFFMQVNYHRPHPPYDPPFEYYQMYQNMELAPEPHGAWSDGFDYEVKNSTIYYGKIPKHQLDEMRRCYYAQLAHLDYHIGRILYFLSTEGLMENTYIIFSTDHGDMLGDHYMSSKYRPFEGSSKIPFIITPPKGSELAKGITNATPATHADMMPTILDIANLPIPQAVEGLSLLPALKGQKIEQRKFIHGEHVMCTQNQGWQYLTDGKQKYAWETFSGQEFFFDLEVDPQELVNLIDNPDHQERIDGWRQQLIAILATRPQHGLSDGQKLICGKVLDPISPELAATATKHQII